MNPRREHFDAIVVGSGFGGSVMAYRLAEAGLRVCLLERGKAYPPGSFPRSPYSMRRNFWDPSEGLYGLFNLWSFKGLGGVVSSGLGGGSLIYANVLLRKDEKSFVQEDLQDGGYEYWPVTRADLDPHYDGVEQMMGAQRYPLRARALRHTAKTLAIKLAAERMGLRRDWQLPPLAVTFANPGERAGAGRAHPRGAPEPARAHAHDLPAVRRVRHRLQLRQQEHARLQVPVRREAARGASCARACEVTALLARGRRLRRRLRGPLGGARGRAARGAHRRCCPSTLISADQLVLAAGTFGTDVPAAQEPGGASRGSATSSARASAATATCWASCCKCVDNSTGKRQPRIARRRPRPGHHQRPRTSGTPPRAAPGRGFYVEDAGYPEFVNWLYESSDQLAPAAPLHAAGTPAREGAGWASAGTPT